MNWGNMGRKRIRGLRRHYRNLRQRASRPSELRRVDVTWLTRHQQTYHKVTADPWLSCKEVPHKPAFRALWVARFVRTLLHWHPQLTSRYATFYLAIWLYEPTAKDFCHSRLMVAVNEQRLLYEHHFGVAQDRPLPEEYLAVPGIKTLEWRAYPQWSSPYTLAEFAQAGPELAAKPQQLVETAQGEPILLVQLGWVWVGQARSQPQA